MKNKKVNDKIRNVRFFCKNFFKNFARDVHFFFHENLIFSSLFISYHWMGGRGESQEELCTSVL